jgi:hypothetical protein
MSPRVPALRAQSDGRRIALAGARLLEPSRRLPRRRPYLPPARRLLSTKQVLLQPPMRLMLGPQLSQPRARRVSPQFPTLRAQMGAAAMAWAAARSGVLTMAQSEPRRHMANRARMPTIAPFVTGRFPARLLVLALPIMGG